MLKFIFGRASSGKTYTILEMIKSLAGNGEKAVLIVPEQFSFEAEKAVLKSVGPSSALSVSVMSFSRIYDEVASVVGGMSGKLLEDADKVIMMKRALVAARDSLNLWGKYIESVSFAKSVLDVIGEFKINSVTPDNLRAAANSVNSHSLKMKLDDIATIYDNYNMIIGERFIDPADKLTKLYLNLEEFKFFEGKTVFIDSFKGFTGQQYKIIGRILSQAKDVYAAFNYEETEDADISIYSNIRKAIQRIKSFAKRNGILIESPIKLYESRYQSENLSALERLMAGERTSCQDDDGSITVCEAESFEDEVNFVARTIKRLVRENGYRYRDFVVIARNAEDYEQAVEIAFKRNSIGCFTDRRIPLSVFPICVAVFSAIEAAKSFSTEGILRFYKTGLCDFSLDDISVLENYTALWNVSGKKWLDDWDMDVRGFVTEEMGEDEQALLEKINELRRKAIKPITDFREDFRGNASSMATAVVRLLKSMNAADALKRMSDNFCDIGNSFSSDLLKQSYRIFMGLLDSIVKCYGDTPIKTDEFIDTLNLAVQSASVGTTPQTLDEVTFGSADRIRPSRPKIAFILGANQGVFPQGASNSGILSIYEREQLINNDIEIADNSVNSVIDENYLVYTSVCCASDKLYISYSKNSLLGEARERSSFVDTLLENINCSFVNEPSAENIPETMSEAFDMFCENYGSNKTFATSLQTSLKDTAFEEKIDAIKSVFDNSSKNITQQNAKRLYGEDIYMSASKLDTFNRCRFSYFCRYGLRLKKIQPADFDALQRGTVVHYVFERLFTDNADTLPSFSADEISRLVDLYIEEYLDMVKGYRSVEDAHSRFIVSRISRLIKEVAQHLAREFAQSSFKPYKCEMKIGKNGDIPELNIPYDSGSIRITGSIDRVDTYNGYIRVIDYKTGSRSFKLPDILFGLNLQMLIYLYAAVRGSGLPDENAAGIFYMHSKRDLNEGGMAMNGLAKGDIDLITAMEKENKGEFVPRLILNKDGSLSKRSNAFISSEDFTVIFDYIEKLISKTGNSIASGDISVNPVNGRESPACKYCDFASLCGIEEGEAVQVPSLSNDKVLEKIKEDNGNGI